MLKSYKFIINGKVQGVYYRVTIQKSANTLNFKGYVKNLSNGNVEACVYCDESQLAQFREILKKGSKSSRVDTIKESPCNEIFTKGFEVR